MILGVYPGFGQLPSLLFWLSYQKIPLHVGTLGRDTTNHESQIQVFDGEYSHYGHGAGACQEGNKADTTYASIIDQ